MRNAVSAVLAVWAVAALVGRADDPEPPAGAAELAKLKGTWAVFRATGNKRELKAPPGLTYSFDGDRLSHTAPLAKGGSHTRKYKVTIDAKKKPHRIEMVLEGQAKALVGLYKIEKGELYLALGKGGKAPADFSGDDGVVFVMKKEAKKGGGINIRIKRPEGEKKIDLADDGPGYSWPSLITVTHWETGKDDLRPMLVKYQPSALIRRLLTGALRSSKFI